MVLDTKKIGEASPAQGTKPWALHEYGSMEHL